MLTQLLERVAARRRIYLVRHGEVSYFDRAGTPQPPDAVPLNDEGIAQSLALREALRDIPLDRVIVTSHPRTRQTAEHVVEGRDLAIETCDALREITPGHLPRTGSLSDLGTHLTGAFATVTRETSFLGGETFGEFSDRVVPAFDEIIACPDWKHLLIVAHGGTNRMILLRALGGGLDGLAQLEQDAGCVNIVDVHEPARLLVRQVNFTPRAPLKENVWATAMEKIFLEQVGGARPPGGGSKK